MENINGNAITEEEKSMQREMEGLQRDYRWCVEDMVQRQEHIIDQMMQLGMPFDEGWSRVVERSAEMTLWQGKQDFEKYVKQLDEKDLTPKQKFYDAMQYLGAQGAQQKMKRMAEQRCKSRFRNFGQLNYTKSKVLEEVAAKNGLAAAIFLYFSRKSDGYNRVVCPYSALKKEFGASERSISRAITLLEEKKMITVYKTGTANEYVLDDNLVWKSRSAQHDKCKFDINIIKERDKQREKRKEKGRETAAKKKAEKEMQKNEEGMAANEDEAV